MLISYIAKKVSNKWKTCYLARMHAQKVVYNLQRIWQAIVWPRRLIVELMFPLAVLANVSPLFAKIFWHLLNVIGHKKLQIFQLVFYFLLNVFVLTIGTISLKLNNIKHKKAVIEATIHSLLDNKMKFPMFVSLHIKFKEIFIAIQK